VAAVDEASIVTAVIRRRTAPEHNAVVRRYPSYNPGSLQSAGDRLGGVAVFGNSVWTLSGGFFATPRVTRVDPGANRPVARINVGNAPTGIAAGEGGIWVSDVFEETVSRIDPANVVTATIPMGRGPSGIVVGAGAVWVAETLENALVRIDPGTNSVRTTIPVGRRPVAVA